MKKNSFLVFIPGKLNFFSKENLNKLKKNIGNHLYFSLFPWNDTDQKKINKFRKIYKPIILKKINKPDYKNTIKKIKYPDYAGNTLGTLYMWESIRQSFLQINTFYKRKKKKPDYIIRYRFDILPKLKKKIFRKKLFKGEILVPDRYHWNGLNDQLFIIKYSDIHLFFELDKFVEKFINDERFFCSEYLFQQFLSYKKIKIKYSDFDYNLMRFKNFKKPSINMKSKMKLKDRINCKINKLKYKFRNLEDYYLKKKYPNKNQEKII